MQRYVVVLHHVKIKLIVVEVQEYANISTILPQVVVMELWHTFLKQLLLVSAYFLMWRNVL